MPELNNHGDRHVTDVGEIRHHAALVAVEAQYAQQEAEGVLESDTPSIETSVYLRSIAHSLVAVTSQLNRIAIALGAPVHQDEM